MHAFVFVGTGSWIGITMSLPEIALIFISNDAYLSGLDVVPILLGAGLLLGVYYNLSVWYKVTDKTIAGAVLSVLGMIITVIFNFMLIPVMGYHGSAWTTLITYLIMVVSSYVWGNKVYKVNYKAVPFVVVFSSGLAISIYLIGLSGDVFTRYLVGTVAVIIYLTIYFLPYIKSNRI
jgi:O-antigen/teichoic acid export membrane protein